MKSALLKVFFVLFISTLPLITMAWNGQGHRAAGAVIYYELKANNHDVIDKVLKTLTYHPWYNTTWATQTKKMSGEKKEVELFMLASTFPDDARGTDLGDGEKTMWHYVDYPFVPAGCKVKGRPPQSPNAQERILELLTAIKAEKDGAQRAIDICWLFHLVEDIHQPLHCTSMFDDNHPEGDKGGNTVFIKVGFGEEQNLHHYWDAAPVDADANCSDKAWELMLKYPEPQLQELKKDTDVVSWIKKESVPLAIAYAYLYGKVNGVQDAPVRLFDDYETNTVQICERRVVLSGIRLAHLLVGLYSPHSD